MGEPVSAVTGMLCSEIERILPCVVCTVLAVDESGQIHPLSAPSLPEGYSRTLEGTMIGPNAGSCGSAAYLRTPVVVEDIATDPRWTAFRDLPLAEGLRACWSTPILDSSERVVGAFAFYFRENRGPSEREQAIVRMCVHLCGIAIERHERTLDRERRANLDALTGLPNQGYFKNALRHLRCDQSGAWAVMLFDLDNLKVTNDTFGHQAGDRLIQTVATRLAAVAAPDRTFRIGGDEFAILLQDPAALGDLETAAARFTSAIAEPVESDEHVIIPSATAGAAVVSSEDASAEQVRWNADLALYHAKETGRGGFVRYRAGFGTRIRNRMNSIENLSLALSEDRVDAYYQPIVRLDTGEIVGLEALCRLISMDGEIIAASQFCDATADARIAKRLTRRMLSLISRDLRTWLDLGIPLQHVGVNVSNVDFRSGHLENEIRAAFGAHRVPLEHVVLEVSEATYLGGRDQVIADSIGAFRDMGVHVSLDDFGTGFASLTHLISVPVNAIKIDRSFVARLMPGDPSVAIVRALLDIGRELRMDVVAEGIETAQQAAMLHELGCSLGQGYYYSRPAPRDIVTGLLLRHAQDMPGCMPIGPAFPAAAPRLRIAR